MKPTAPSRTTTLISIALLFTVLILPNLAIMWFKLPRFPSGFPPPILAIAITAAWFAVFYRMLWLGCLLLVPVALLMPLELYYILNYHTQTTMGVLGIIATTTPAETRQYLGGAAIPLIIGCLASLAIALAASWFAWRSNARWRGRTSAALIFICVLVAGALSLVDLAHSHRTLLRKFDMKAAKAIELGRLKLWMKNGYPFGVPMRIVDFIDYKRRVHHAMAGLRTFRFHAHLATPLPTRQVYVLVIGESSRRDHWQLFGYKRPTNPMLTQEKNLIPINKMVSAGNYTNAALPVMLTRRPAAWPAGKFWPEPSIVQVMREAGFDTWWISNQYITNAGDSAFAIYSDEANHVKWLNPAPRFSDHGSLDEALVASLRHALSTSAGNMFIVLHMLGSHDYYDYRYPPSFAKFKPTQSSHAPTKTPGWERAVNSYDNTILYTDHVLSQIIGVLENSKTTAALWYSSDHGESLKSPTCNERGHGHKSRPDYIIPALFWYSNSYEQAFPGRVTAIKDNADKLTMSENIFPSLTDMAGIDFPGHAKHEEWSLFSRNWAFHTRWTTEINFDAVKIDANCLDLSNSSLLEDKLHSKLLTAINYQPIR